MGIHPRQMASGPQGRVWEEIGDLKRELRAIREGRVAQIQHASATGDASNVTTGPPGVAVCSVDLSLPMTSAVLMMWLDGVATTTTNMMIGLQDSAGDWSGVKQYLQVSGSGVPIKSNATVPNPVSGTWQGSFRVPWYPYESTPASNPTVGAHTYTLAIYSIGGAPASLNGASIRALVL